MGTDIFGYLTSLVIFEVAEKQSQNLNNSDVVVAVV
jgi:hypothetical protein